MAGGPHVGCSCYWFKLIETPEQYVRRVEAAVDRGAAYVEVEKRKAYAWTEAEARGKVAKALGVEPERLERCDTPWRRHPGNVWTKDGKEAQRGRAD